MREETFMKDLPEPDFILEEFSKEVTPNIIKREAFFLYQIASTGKHENVSYVKLFNGDVLFGFLDWTKNYYSVIFQQYKRQFMNIGIGEESYAPAFEALISYEYENTHESPLKSCFIKKDDIVLDVGTRTGQFVVKASRLVGEKGKIISIDPMQLAEKAVKLHVKYNNLTNVKFVRALVGSEKNDNVKFYSGSENEAFSGIYPNTYDINNGNVVVSDAHHTKIEYLKMTTIDDILLEQKINRCHFIIMQINGAELEALKGSINTLKKLRPILHLCAFQSQDVKDGNFKEEIIDFLKPYGYKIFFKSNTHLICIPNEMAIDRAH